MSRHRRRRIGLFVSRSTYMSLWARYADLAERYRALEGDHQSVLEDHEGLLYSLPEELPEPEPAEALESPVRPRRTPSWAQTEEVPVITSLETGLDPDKAEALVRRTRLLDDPSGAWGVNRQVNG